jgi:amidase
MSAADVGKAMTRQTRMFQDTQQFLSRYEYFVLPVTQVSPFDVDLPYPTRINDTPMTSYIDWMRSCWYVTFMGCPAISVPAGFTRAGVPVGLQIVGRHRADWSVLQIAHAFERETRYGRKRATVLDA